jgi:hypothetical protein
MLSSRVLEESEDAYRHAEWEKHERREKEADVLQDMHPKRRTRRHGRGPTKRQHGCRGRGQAAFDRIQFVAVIVRVGEEESEVIISLGPAGHPIHPTTSRPVKVRANGYFRTSNPDPTDVGVHSLLAFSIKFCAHLA